MSSPDPLLRAPRAPQAGPPLRRWMALTVPLLATLLAPCSEPVPEERPNLLFVLVDTLRADHLGTYGYERDTSPRLDALARRGYVFEQARSVCNWTNPTIVSLFTGHYPQAVFEPAQHRRAIELVLPAEEATLAEALRDGGYRTRGLVDHPGINKRRGYDQGFEEYELLFVGAQTKGWDTTDADYVLAQVEQVFDEPSDDPFFLYLHLVYPHAPYGAPEPYASMFGAPHDEISRDEVAGMVNAYDGEIRYTDDLLGRIYAAMEARGLDQDTWLLVTSDHGEAFWEHDVYEHGYNFYDEVQHVPLILVPPAGLDEGRRIEPVVSNVDVFPTLLDLARVPAKPSADGRSLARFFGDTDGDADEEPVLFMESPRGNDIEAMAVIQGTYKFVEYPNQDGGLRQLFDLASDPEETRDVLQSEPQRVTEMVRQLRAHRADVARRRALVGVEERPADAETVDRLRALGYTDD